MNPANTNGAMRQILTTIGVMAVGLIIVLFVHGDFNGHPIAWIGWIMMGAGGLALIIMLMMTFRQQNINRDVSSNMLRSNKTRMFMRDDVTGNDDVNI